MSQRERSQAHREGYTQMKSAIRRGVFFMRFILVNTCFPVVNRLTIMLYSCRIKIGKQIQFYGGTEW